MGRYGTWHPLGAQTQRRMTGHNIACVHTMVGSLFGTERMFEAGGYSGTESHWGLGENADQGMRQWQDMLYSADANLEGWADVLSLETADYGGSFGFWDTGSAANVPEWNDWQCEAIARWLEWVTHPRAHTDCPATWLCHRVGIPLVLIPDTMPGRRGVGYHKQGCVPFKCPSCRRWSTAYAKGCPGDRRIAQIRGIIARAWQIRAGYGGQGEPAQPIEEDDDDMPQIISESVPPARAGDGTMLPLDDKGRPQNMTLIPLPSASDEAATIKFGQQFFSVLASTACEVWAVLVGQFEADGRERPVPLFGSARGWHQPTRARTRGDLSTAIPTGFHGVLVGHNSPEDVKFMIEVDKYVAKK